ncbi:MAG: glycoside hydrolase family 8 [Candidatus Paceibacter sp.]|jgi:endoglucanase|nr:glycoside hydrolase family 8 [Candidatus Paceibacter sp.]
MSQRAWGILLIVIAFIILGFIAYKNSIRRQVPIIFSPRNELASLWDDYKKEYLEEGTYRVLDKQKDNITTSEGQSYAMMRAVWMDDKDTFDKTWQWTKDNLQRDDNKLMSWLFGRLPNGEYGILENQGGHNTATDADVDIAIALIFASGRWNQESYLGDARVIMDAIWEHEVVMIRGRPYLVANNIEKDAPTTMVINPSYLSPYAYRIFASIDSSHPWLQLVDTSYEVLEESMTSTLDKSTSADIPPDWVFINKQTGAIQAPKGNNLTTNTSFDALRVPWRLYLDWLWYKEPRAQALLKKMSFFTSEWQERSLLYTAYEHDGTPVLRNQSAAFYGGVLPYFMAADPENAKLIYDNKLQVLFNPDTNTWKVQLGYYDDNWAWFGIALYNNLLPNLAIH